MKRAVAIGGSVVGAAALLGVGVAVGTQVGAEQQAETMAAEAAAQVPQGFADSKEQMRLSVFVSSADEFQRLLNKATRGQPTIEIGNQMIGHAVTVRAIKRTAATNELRDAADSLSQAMLFIGAGVMADEGGITEEGIAAYKAADEKVKVLSDKVTNDPNLAPQSSPSTVPSPAAS